MEEKKKKKMHTFYTILSQKSDVNFAPELFSRDLQLCYVTFQDNSAEVIVKIS